MAIERLGPYRILESLGAGGMGEVFLAEDTRLDRKVAVKVLPDEFAGDPERLARFEQEAKAAAALNHPHIAAVHDVGLDAGTHYIVQEYLRGKTLRDALSAGPLSIDRTLELGTEIAEALKAAHRAGVVHRDLKPENVFVTEDGHAKVLDFGLAKLTEIGAGPGNASASMSPTMLGTQAGQIMGTAGYMAPEQVQGENVDARADLFAFGCLLYEMATARQPFAGKNVYETLGRIVSDEPEPIERVVTGLPAELQRIIRKCLAKDRERRCQSAADLVVDLGLLQADVDSGTAVKGGAPPGVAQLSVPMDWRTAIPTRAALGVGTALVFASAGAAWFLMRQPEPSVGEATRLEIALGNSPVDTVYGAGAALSLDGRRIAYTTDAGAAAGLYVRSLGDLEPVRIVEAGVDNPFFSPDGQWVAYEQNNVLWKVPVTGGSPLRLVEAVQDRGTAWTPDGHILLVPTVQSGISILPDVGGEAQPLTGLAEGEAAHRWPQVLPGGRRVLFSSHTSTTDWDGASIEVFDRDTGERKVVYRGGYYPRYVRSGHLVFASRGSVFAIRFDLDRLETSGSAFPVLQGVSMNPDNGGAQYSVADNGTLLYLTGNTVESATEVVRVDPQGGVRAIWSGQGLIATPRLSPDGRRLAVTNLSRGGADLWTYELDRDVLTRLTFDGRGNWAPVWSHDGARLFSASNRSGQYLLYSLPADGSGGPEPVGAQGEFSFPSSVSPDGKLLGFQQFQAEGSMNVRVLSLDDASEVTDVAATAAMETDMAFSPDGRWIAYMSRESGEPQVYVTAYPARGKWQISDAAGGQPRWSRDGRKLYYRTVRGVAVVDVDTTDGVFRPGRPRTLFEGEFLGGPAGIVRGGFEFPDYEVAPDGESFIMLQAQGAGDGAQGPQLATLVLDWFQELRRLTPQSP